MITVIVAGNVGKSDAEVRESRTGGDSVTSFSVAGTSGFGKSEKTEWFNCSLWGTRGEKIAEYITAGSPITVQGELSTRKWMNQKNEEQTSLELRVDKIKLQGGKRDDGGRTNDRRDDGRDQKKAGKPAFDQDLDDEMPF